MYTRRDVLRLSAASAATVLLGTSIQAPAHASGPYSISDNGSGSIVTVTGSATSNAFCGSAAGWKSSRVDGNDANGNLSKTYIGSGLSNNTIEMSITLGTGNEGEAETAGVTASGSLTLDIYIHGPAHANSYTVNVKTYTKGRSAAWSYGDGTFQDGEFVPTYNDNINISSSTPVSFAALNGEGFMSDPTDDSTYNNGPVAFQQVTIGTDGKGRLTLPFSATAQMSTESYDFRESLKSFATFDMVVVIDSIIGPDGTSTL